MLLKITFCSTRGLSHSLLGVSRIGFPITRHELILKCATVVTFHYNYYRIFDMYIIQNTSIINAQRITHGLCGALVCLGNMSLIVNCNSLSVIELTFSHYIDLKM